MTADEANSGDPERQDLTPRMIPWRFCFPLVIPSPFVAVAPQDKLREGPAFQGRRASGGFFGSVAGSVSLGADGVQNAVTCGAT
jgi:hypothetical protein